MALRALLVLALAEGLLASLTCVVSTSYRLMPLIIITHTGFHMLVFFSLFFNFTLQITLLIILGWSPCRLCSLLSSYHLILLGLSWSHSITRLRKMFVPWRQTICLSPRPPVYRKCLSPGDKQFVYPPSPVCEKCLSRGGQTNLMDGRTHIALGLSWAKLSCQLGFGCTVNICCLI